MKIPSFLLLSLLLPAWLLAADQPNIVFILADDMGSGDVQALNPDSKIPTPHLNQMAADGMTFTDAHSPSAVCTPTRYGVVTGRYCWRTYLKRGVLNGYGKPLIQKGRVTVADYLKEGGYNTAVVGKWHLGLGFVGEEGDFDFSKPLTDTPVDHGFDYSYVIPASLDFPPYVYIEGHDITEFPSVMQEKSFFPDFWRAGERSPGFIFEEALDHLTTKACDYIGSQKDAEKPFFLYFPLTAPHKPATPHPRFRGKSGLGPYGDFIMQVDWTVGEVMKAIDDAGLREDTIVFYTSDNGSYMYRRDPSQPDHVAEPTDQGFHPDNHTANHVYRGTKADVWEAGHRVPFFVRWPGKIAAGSKSETTITHTDFFATAAEVAGLDAPKGDTAPDSFSIVPLFSGKEWNRAPVINHSANGMFAIREGKWKLVLGNGSGGRQTPKGKAFEKPYELFDLQEDISETTNVIDQHPELASKLEKACLEIRDSGSSR